MCPSTAEPGSDARDLAAAGHWEANDDYLSASQPNSIRPSVNSATCGCQKRCKQLRDLRVFVDQAAEPVVSQDADVGVRGVLRERSHWCCLVQRPVRTVGVDVVLFLGRHSPGMRCVEDQNPVQQLAADTADEPLRDRVRPRSPHRDRDHVRADRGEHGVERRGESGVAVPDQEPGTVPGVFQVDRQVAGLLSQPRPGRVCGHAEDANPAGGVFDGEECGGAG